MEGQPVGVVHFVQAGDAMKRRLRPLHVIVQELHGAALALADAKRKHDALVKERDEALSREVKP